MSARLIAKQGLDTERRFFQEEVKYERMLEEAKLATAIEPVAKPKWHITSYLTLARNRRMSQIRRLFGMPIAHTRSF